MWVKSTPRHQPFRTSCARPVFGEQLHQHGVGAAAVHDDHGLDALVHGGDGGL